MGFSWASVQLMPSAPWFVTFDGVYHELRLVSFLPLTPSHTR